jgi:hypothetical protein
MNVYKFLTEEMYYVIAHSFKEACGLFFDLCEDEDLLNQWGGFDVEILPEEEIDKTELFNEDTKNYESLREILQKETESCFLASTINF